MRTRTNRLTVRMLALAAAVAPAAAMAEGSPSLEEIQITSTKTASTVATTAASVSVVGADELGPGGVGDIGDLMVAIPNLSVGDQFGVARIFIRGIGMTSIDLGADGAVAVHQDGAILARPAAQMSGYYDIERVEVLRGPQGTLYGRGATAGAIDLITKRPTRELAGYGRVTIGNYGTENVEGALSGPFGDAVAGRLAFKKEKREGFGENLFTGNDVDDRDAYALRGGLLFNPSDDLEIYLTGEHFEEDDNNYAFHFFGTSVVPEDGLAHNLLGGTTIFDIKGANASLGDLRDIYSDDDAVNEREGSAATMVVDWDIDGAWSLKSITSWHDFKRFNRDDLDVSDVWMFGQNNYEEDSETWSQEFTLNYSTDKLDFLAGAMYFTEDLYGSVKVPTVNLAVLFNALIPGLNLPPSFFDNGNYWQNGDVKVDAAGVYAQAKYAITPKLSITAGARYNYEEREGTGSFTFEAQGINVPTDRKKDWDDITPTLKLEYTTDSDALLYVSATRGFKSGVINVGSLNAVIDPEYVTAFEAGAKSHFMDGRVYASLAGFYYKYKDLQVGFVNPQNIVETINAAKARNWGLELETTAQITDAFSVDFFATHLDAEFEEFIQNNYRTGNPADDLKGNSLANAPKNTLRLGLNYDIGLADAGSLRLRGDVNWQDKVYFTEFNNQDAVQDDYAMLNASIEWRSANDAFSAMLWARNLADKDVIANNITTAPLYGYVRVGSMMPPRTYGLTFGYEF